MDSGLYKAKSYPFPINPQPEGPSSNAFSAQGAMDILEKCLRQGSVAMQKKEDFS